MYLAINTGSLSFDSHEAIAQVHALGFSAVEMNLQRAELAYGFDQTPDLAFYGELTRELQVRKLTVTDVHALFLNAAQMFSVRARRAVLSVEGQVTKVLGSGILVVHPTDILESEERLDQFCADPNMKAPFVGGIASVVRELQSGGVRIALENVQHWRNTCGTNQAEVMARLVEALNCGVTLDVRRGLDRPSLDRWLELVGDRIVVYHLHDTVEGTEHHPPVASDWRHIIPQLQRTSAQVYVMEATAERSPGAIKVSREYISKLLQMDDEQ
jgi:sugar phosphate isomerase/epimerase